MRIVWSSSSSFVVTSALVACLSGFVALTGCNSAGPLIPADARTLAGGQGGDNAARQEIEQIPPPSKTRYLAVRSLSNWENPYLTVNGGLVTLHVMVADKNTSDLGQGGLLRPSGARRQDLDVRLGDLAGALEAVPHDAWPYGRVVAVEEAHNTPASAKPQVRKNLEVAMQTLNDVGVVAYEWSENGPGLR